MISAAVLAFISEAIQLAPLFMQAFGEVQSLIDRVSGVVKSGSAPTDADVADLKALRDQATATLHQRDADLSAGKE